MTAIRKRFYLNVVLKRRTFLLICSGNFLKGVIGGDKNEI